MQKENARKTTIYDNIVNVISNSNSEYRRLAGWQGINAILPHVDMNKLKNLDTGSNVQMAMTAQYQRVILTGNALEGTGYITKSYNEVKDVLTQLIKQETDPEVMAEAKMAMRCLQAE